MKKDNTKTSLFNRKRLISYLIFTIIFILTSSLSLLFIYRFLNTNTAVFTIRVFPPETMIQTMLLFIFYILMDSLRLLYILKSLNISIEYTYILKLGFIHLFISNITPFSSGGGLAQIYFLNRKNVPLGNAIVVSTIKAILPITFFFVTAPIILLLNRDLINILPTNNIYIYSLVFGFIYIVIIYGVYKLFHNPRIIKIIISKTLLFIQNRKLISKKTSYNYQRKSFREINNFFSGIKLFLKGKKINIILSLLSTALFLISLFLFPVILIKGLRYNISSLSIIIKQIVITFIAYFAPTPGASGVSEGGFTLLFSNLIKKEHLISLTFTWRFFTIYLGMFIGMIVFYYEAFKKRNGGNQN
ncbi:lysylphosphatidylglycerol synthase transmembrane domain-containing protein [Dethiothermospora halolimnae]|uniref:lysylphosphatidylglycerol synthase transmembrane domain-containing protein n=1 Tax=Dethiothermospora halolimnae TaxID=3114390 RepID=UPI003CCC1BA9